ncbi:hypothetical protein OKA04_15730 [Luteolibacter flavescens]|uniref:FecR protein domain-containing protein n=1 Tax=Luteolibacter flavescens TaxID=1859460 RepID=A0ABT3FRI3_9BACT|nr:hypothetical protein [Luteolibacter flavescens]MCW1886188.1 hypothetical protein [Luteolibacter flavescens]
MMNRRDLERHLQAFFDGTLEDEHFAALQEVLRRDPEARACYREYLHLHHLLSFRAKGPDRLPADLLEEIMPPAPPVRFPRRGRWMLAAAAVVALLATLAGSMMAWRQSQRPPLRYTASPGTDISVTSELAPTGQRAQGPFLEPGSQLEIGDGTMELEFSSGVRGIVRGPASFRLYRKDLLELERGTAWFHVPEKAADFKVSTPDLILKETGAEFGVIADPAFLSEVHVFHGSIEATSRHGRRTSKRVGAGTAQAAEDTGEWQEIPVRRGRFLTSLPGVEPESNVIVSKESSPVDRAYENEASADDLLTGIVPLTTGWKLQNNASPLELTDGIHGAGFQKVQGDMVQGAWTTVGATAEYRLGIGPNGAGYNITMIRSLADWENVGFGNQAWTMEVKPVGRDWMPLASVVYDPLPAQLTSGGSTKVTVTGKDGRLAQGIEAIKVTAGRVPGSVQHGFVWRELDVFGAPADVPVTGSGRE